MTSGSIESVLPRASDLPGPMTSLTGDWRLDIEGGKPVLKLDLTWTAESDRSVGATLGLVAVVQTPTVYVTFLDIQLPPTMQAGTRYEIRNEYEWDRFLRTEISGGERSFLNAGAAKQSINDGIRLSQIVITKAEFAAD